MYVAGVESVGGDGTEHEVFAGDLWQLTPGPSSAVPPPAKVKWMFECEMFSIVALPAQLNVIAECPSPGRCVSKSSDDSGSWPPRSVTVPLMFEKDTFRATAGGRGARTSGCRPGFTGCCGRGPTPR